MERQLAVGHTLGEESTAEVQVDDGTADPRDEAGGVGEVDEPIEDDGGGGAGIEVSEEGEQAGCADAAVGYIFLEHFWSGC